MAAPVVSASRADRNSSSELAPWHTCTQKVVSFGRIEGGSRAVQGSYREVAALDVVHMLAPVLEVCSSTLIDVYNPFDARRAIGVRHVNEAVSDRLLEGCRQKSRDAILLTNSKERLVLVRQRSTTECSAEVGKLCSRDETATTATWQSGVARARA